MYSSEIKKKFFSQKQTKEKTMINVFGLRQPSLDK